MKKKLFFLILLKWYIILKLILFFYQIDGLETCYVEKTGYGFADMKKEGHRLISVASGPISNEEQLSNTNKITNL